MRYTESQLNEMTDEQLMEVAQEVKVHEMVLEREVGEDLIPHILVMQMDDEEFDKALGKM